MTTINKVYTIPKGTHVQLINAFDDEITISVKFKKDFHAPEERIVARYKCDCCDDEGFQFVFDYAANIEVSAEHVIVRTYDEFVEQVGTDEIRPFENEDDEQVEKAA